MTETAGTAKVSMAALTSMTNPVSPERYLVFYNDSNAQLAQAQGYKRSLGSALWDFSNPSVTNEPAGTIADPSSIACALYDGTINVYGVVNGLQNTLLVCRLSPGFDIFNIGNQPISNSSSITACSDGHQTGVLFCVIPSTDSPPIPQVYGIALPGTSQTAEPLNIQLNLNANTLLGSAYGSLASQPVDAYVAMQTFENELFVVARHNSLSAPITTKGMKNTPIACVFVGQMLIVYYFGIVGTGNGNPNASPLLRATTTDMQKFDVQMPQTAPSPGPFTQLTAFATSGPANDGRGSVILTYVQYTNNGTEPLISWEDDLTDDQGQSIFQWVESELP